MSYISNASNTALDAEVCFLRDSSCSIIHDAVYELSLLGHFRLLKFGSLGNLAHIKKVRMEKKAYGRIGKLGLCPNVLSSENKIS